MSLYVIADLHLSKNQETNKSMEVFGPRWQNYMERIETNWQHLIAPSDTVLIPGDISWAMYLEEAVSDFSFLDHLNGHKILLKGNHDFWWTSLKKMNAFLEDHHFSSISFLYHSSMVIEDFIVAGTRGWFIDDFKSMTKEESDKVRIREGLRLEMALKEAVKLQNEYPEKELIACLHFPPIYNGVPSENLTTLLETYQVKQVFYGHLHGQEPIERTLLYHEIPYTLIASDSMNFTPYKITPKSH